MDIFVARQPILDVNQHLYGYELLFRSSPENVFPGVEADYASSQVINTSTFIFGGSLTVGKRAFVNVSRRMLLSDFHGILPPESTVIELLETVTPDEEVIAACRELKRSGYLLALDDFVASPGCEPLIQLADILKVDFLTTEPEKRRELANRYRSDCLLLAEKVETLEDFREGLELGYEYFQGFFFCRPEMISRREIPSVKLSYLQFMQEISRPDLDFERLEQIIKREVSLTVKLLRLLKSAAFGLGDRVSSVKQALIFLGERPLRRWATMLAMCGMAEDKAPELLVTSLVRGHLCEQLGREAGLDNYRHELFLVGMLSLLDALVGRPMSEVLAELGLSTEIRAGILENDSSLGRVRSLAIALEQANWSEAAPLGKDLGISESVIPDLYAQATEWTREVSQL